jgi:hypothetical protein
MVEMKFPYTLGAAARRIPFQYAWRNSPMFRYWLLSLAFVTTPIYLFINKAVNVESNKALWREKRRQLNVDWWDPYTCPIGKH